MNLKKNIVYIVNHKTKSFVESTLPLDFASLLPAEMAGIYSVPSGYTRQDKLSIQDLQNQ